MAYESESSTTQEKDGLLLCGVCNANPGKYKCPRCRMPYCSVSCNKSHKENHPPDPEPPRMPPPIHVYVPQEGNAEADPSNQFAGLDNCTELKRLVDKYPYLLDQLMAINAAFQPVPPRRGMDDRWRREEGKRRGLAALRRARNAPGAEGEAIREYDQLILFLIRRDENGRQGQP